jgi:protoheme ferro-lyase
MTYEEIMKISDIEEKQEKLKEFYINEIGVNEYTICKCVNASDEFVEAIKNMIK